MNSVAKNLGILGVSATAGYLISKKYKNVPFLGATALVGIGIYAILIYADYYAWNKTIASKDV